MPLQRMTLHNFVVVESLEIDFEPGFTALTGETGAGKSILIDALQMILGARADAGLVREGAGRADLSAEFAAPAQVQRWLGDAGFDAGGELLLRRTVDTSGKSRGWINGIPATASQLRELGAALLDIHGQHAWQNLMQSGAVRALLDAFAGAETQEVQKCWSAWRAATQALQAAREAQASAGAERERLQWQISELDKLAPKSDEWEPLNAQHNRLSHAQALLDAAQAAATHLGDEEASARATLTRALQALAPLEHLEPRFGEISALLGESLAQTDEALRELHAYLRRDALDTEQLHQLDERVAQWLGLARRFRRPPEDLPEMLASWKAQLAALDRGSDLDALGAREREAQAAYLSAAKLLSQERKKAAGRLSAAVTSTLQKLGMEGGQLVVDIAACAQPGAMGIDDVDFLVAGHAGLTPRPIAKVASGGELSRIALAIAVATSARGSAGTLIFDEVDSGVGGAVAETVGLLMQQLGRTRQVLAVTHLPQVAACADHHLLVTKVRTPHGPSSTVVAAQGTERLAEVARMLGGEKPSRAGLEHAREMLGQNQQPAGGD